MACPMGRVEGHEADDETDTDEYSRDRPSPLGRPVVLGPAKRPMVGVREPRRVPKSGSAAAAKALGVPEGVLPAEARPH